LEVDKEAFGGSGAEVRRETVAFFDKVVGEEVAESFDGEQV
jgi:hypothetical protein